jgi:MoaA/NifB/PqqE/SkfB family radical SAM enzyme
MYQFHEITTLHLEVTSQCNASCPMCLRNVSGGKVNPHLPITELRFDSIRNFFPEDFIRSLKRMYMCGNYGDPLVAKDTLEIFRYFRAVNPEIHLAMFTNGSARGPEWWRELASVIDLCHFGVDGLEDTNHLYRRKTNFKKIMENAKAYIDQGGNACWDFIVFAHNEHQLEAARALSEEMGFKKITFKKTGRFFSYSKAQVKEAQEVLNADGSLDYEIFPPQNPKYYNDALKSDARIIEKYGSFDCYFDQAEIHCKVAEEKSLYVTAEGLVFPCCWVGLRLYPWYSKEKADPVWKLIDQLEGGLEALSLAHHPMKDIVEGPFFQKVLPESWEKSSLSEGKLKVCAKTCGKKFDAFASQFKA